MSQFELGATPRAAPAKTLSLILQFSQSVFVRYSIRGSAKLQCQKHQMNRFNLQLLLVLAGALSAQAEWPSRVFAPYLFLGAGDGLNMTECADACGLRHYTLAFIIARQEGNRQEAKYFKEPAWNGRISMDQDLYKDQIDAIRKRGGDVIVSFGGEGGRELAIVEEDAAALTASYQSIIDRYGFTWLDFDIEGDNLKKQPAANQRRNTALAALQAKNAGLRISFTLPVDPDGISEAAQAMLADAKTKAVKIHSADLMVMYFGKKFVNKDKSEGELGIDSANKAYEQIQKIDPAIQIGLCPCLGNNGSKDEVFTLEDAKTLRTFADKTPWICSLHYWSVNGDLGRPRRRRPANSTISTNAAGIATSTNTANTPAETPRSPWTFANIFKSFTTAMAH
jgi:chitinase